MIRKNGDNEKPPGSGRPARAWQRMLSGRRLDLLDPSPVDIEIEDIALGLARVARWNGQTAGAHPFSVAQHSVVVERLLTIFKPRIDRRWRLAALLHDAPEYVIGDMISPFKAALGIDYRDFEHKLQAAIHIRFGLPARLPPRARELIKRADRACAYLEATRLAGFSPEEAERYFKRPRGLKGMEADDLLALEPWPTEKARAEFLRRFQQLR